MWNPVSWKKRLWRRPGGVRRGRIGISTNFSKKLSTEVMIENTMRAAVYRGVDQIRIEDVPVPEIGSGELLVKVAACGVCPTDIKKIHYGTVPPPRIFGHETAGTIVRVGAR